MSGADLARMERYEPDATVTGVAAWSRVPAQLVVGTRFALDGSSIARDVRRTGGAVRLESFAGKQARSLAKPTRWASAPRLDAPSQWPGSCGA